VGNFRKPTDELSCDDIKELKAARDHAKAIGLPLNTHVAFSPYCDTDGVPPAQDIAESFKRLLTYLSIWTRRHTGARFTYIRIAHSDEDGSGRNPHLHVLMHLPNAKIRDDLQAALTAVHGYTYAGDLIAKVSDGFQPILHESGYLGSSFYYLTRYKTQQAYYADRRAWRASRRDEKGRHRGIKCPFVGRRWNVSRNINAKSRQPYDDAAIATRAARRIAAERRKLAA
jgi:hypothetical protein